MEAGGRAYSKKANSEKDNGSVTGGPATEQYSQFVRTLFARTTNNKAIGSLVSQFYDDEHGPAVSATAQLKADMMLDKGSTNAVYMPVDLSCSLADKISQADRITSDDLHVYQPISNRSAARNRRETFYQKKNPENYGDFGSSGEHARVLPPYRNPNHFGQTKRQRPIVLDYGSFNSPPLSPYLYLNHKYVGKEDSRIVGSEFVMLNLRKNDDFLAKVHDTLMKAREVNSWSS